jgi:geranylgeranyl reductase family protein
LRVLVICAGPSGASAALELARAGVAVSLVERHAWPREKTCGDGVSPLGVREGGALGLTFDAGLRLPRALVSTPRETAFRGGWPGGTPWGTTIERRIFDASIVDAAVAAGASFSPSTTVRGIVCNDDGVVATLTSGSQERELRADAVFIGEGATGGIAKQLGFPPFRSRLVAVRGYTELPHAIPPEYGLFYDRLLSPGYGWIFPMDERRANVGILVDERMLARRGGDLRALLIRWMAESRFARELLGDAPQLHDIRGGVIPSGRARRTASRAFLIGDAAGVADPFTAEGIFQAMQSARLAARSVIESPDIESARRRYERSLRVFDRNERAARGLRATFNMAIEPYARHAAANPRYADRLNTDAFFVKKSLLSFVWGLTKAW